MRTFFFSSLIPTHKPVGCDAISNWIDRRGIAAEAAGGWGYVTSPEKEMETSFPPLGLLAFPSPTLIKDQKDQPWNQPPMKETKREKEGYLPGGGEDMPAGYDRHMIDDVHAVAS